MAKPHEKLAESLHTLKALQDQGHRVIRSRSLSRTHRARLVNAGFLAEVIKGWYLPARPGEPVAGTEAWFAGMRDFVAGYCNERFGIAWHLSPEQSLLLHSGERTLPRQLQVWAPAGNNQAVALPHGCSLFLYRSRLSLPAGEVQDEQGLRLVNLPDALVAASPSFFSQNPLAARIALGQVEDTAPLLERLLEGSHSTVAGRLAGGFRALGNEAFADAIIHTMRSAGYTVQPSSPFVHPQDPLPGGRPESPHVQRLRLNWSRMRPAVLAAFEDVRNVVPSPDMAAQVVENAEHRYVSDAYHSLSIEGYRVSTELIERVRDGIWDPDGADRQQRDAMAAKGYFEAHKMVMAFIGQAIANRTDAPALREPMSRWYVALFSPGVQAGLLKPSDLAGWRNDQVYIRGARHVPLSKEAVRDCMPVLFQLLHAEPEPVVRAVLGHFFFVYIHPYMDGNGRLARFLMNSMLVTGGYVWTIIPVQLRSEYMKALDIASSDGDIAPFASFVAGLVSEQTLAPLPLESRHDA
jgi:Fic family protein